ncbi:MAG: acyltransferase family protein, partial [Opitutaceae bacterium]
MIPDRVSQTGSPIAAGSRNPQLDGLRAFAAVAVAVYHSVLQLDPSQIQRILSHDIWNIPGGYGTVDKVVLSIWNGQTAVAVFFVLSGAVLFGTLQQRKFRPLVSSIDFTVKRILRIYPALFVCLIIYTLVVLAMGDHASVSQF